MDYNIINGETDFAIKILQNIDTESSTVFSPLAVILSLCLAHAGARGDTRREIRQAIIPNSTDAVFVNHFSHLLNNVTNSTKVDVAMGYKLYTTPGINLENVYLNNLKENYNSTVEKVRFTKRKEAAENVNNYFNSSTQGQVGNIVDEDFFDNAVAFILSGLYFRGHWQMRFLGLDTQYQEFHRNYTPYNTVQYMVNMEGEYRLYAEDDDCEALKLPYEDTRYSFIYILPKPTTPLENLKKRITGAKLQALLNNMTSIRTNIIVPKIRLTYEVDLKQLLPKIGIKSPFTHEGDLSGIYEGITISEAKTKSHLDVDEFGVHRHWSLQRGHVPYKIKEGSTTFIADSSFMFALVYNEDGSECHHLLHFGQFTGDGGINGYPEERRG